VQPRGSYALASRGRANERKRIYNCLRSRNFEALDSRGEMSRSFLAVIGAQVDGGSPV
jgi:hypothetical protein